jgi:two-component system sensor kinase FixL
MNWVNVIWSMTGGICLTLAGLHLLVWLQARDSWTSFVFSISALAAAACAGLELVLMRTQMPAQWGEVLRWMLLPSSVLIISLVWFIRLFLGAGRTWLAWLICGVRALVLALDFVVAPNLHFREIIALRHVSLWGETVSVAVGVLSPWASLRQVSLALFLVYVIDAAVAAGKQGPRRRGLIMGATMSFAIVLWALGGALLDRGLLPAAFIAPIFLLIVLVIAYELTSDVTRATQLARELRETQERMRLATTAADLGVWEWDIARDEIWATEASRALAGLGESERINFNRFLQLLHPDDREPTRQAVHRSLEAGGEFEVEYRMVIADGSMRWLASRGRVERGNDGHPLRVRGVSLDITRRMNAEQDSKKAAELNQKVLASLRSHIAILNRSGTIIAVNDAWNDFALANGAGAYWLGVNYLNVCRSAASAGDATALPTLEGIRSVLEAASECFEMEYSCDSPSKHRSFLMRVVPLRTSDGGAVVSHTDITQLRRAEVEAQELRRDLMHVQRASMMGVLASALAHELNQPLGAILRNAEAGELFLQQNPPDYEELRAILADIRRDDQRAGAVIDRMRSLLKRRDQQLEPLSLKELLGHVAVLMRAEMQSRQMTLQLEVPSRLPLVHGDRVQLQQVLLNLLMNGLDAADGLPSERRQLVVSARRADRETVEVAVSDRGHGIPLEKLAHLFEPFWTTKSEGLGVGLAISQSIIGSHGGRIQAENNPDGGATFRFTLKVSSGDARETEVEGRAREAATS